MQEQTNVAYHEGCQEFNYCLQLIFLHMATNQTDTPDSSQQATGAGLLLSMLLHPQVEMQATAEQMQQLKWLREAAAVPLAMPFCYLSLCHMQSMQLQGFRNFWCNNQQ